MSHISRKLLYPLKRERENSLLYKKHKIMRFQSEQCHKFQAFFSLSLIIIAAKLILNSVVKIPVVKFCAMCAPL